MKVKKVILFPLLSTATLIIDNSNGIKDTIEINMMDFNFKKIPFVTNNFSEKKQ